MSDEAVVGPDAAIELDQVVYRWPGQAEACLDIPALTIAVGERVFLYGPSGSGKSTLLGVLGTAALAWLTAAQTRTQRRMQRAEATNESLWLYTRILLDAHFSGGLGPPPPPPEHIRHLYEIGNTS